MVLDDSRKGYMRWGKRGREANALAVGCGVGNNIGGEVRWDES